jgi:hypothetical protein
MTHCSVEMPSSCMVVRPKTRKCHDRDTGIAWLGGLCFDHDCRSNAGKRAHQCGRCDGQSTWPGSHETDAKTDAKTNATNTRISWRCFSVSVFISTSPQTQTGRRVFHPNLDRRKDRQEPYSQSVFLRSFFLLHKTVQSTGGWRPGISRLTRV